jgi:glycolate oxidase FAD binding subunit
MATQLLPSQILLLNSSVAQAIAPDVASSVASSAVLLLVNCEGMDEAVERQLTDIARLCQGHGASAAQVLSGEAQRRLQTRLEALALSSPLQLDPLTREGLGGKALTIRLGTLPSRVHTVMEAATRALEPLVSRTLIIGDCGVGMVKLCLGSESLTTGAIDAPLVDALRQLSGLVAAHGGHAVVENAPPAAKTQLEVWGLPPSSFALLKALKRKFDPEGVLSPGRFIGGV